MYAPTDNAPPPQPVRAEGMIMTSRAALRTRPLHQRLLIRYWEYIPTVRVTVLALRLLGALCLAVIGIALLSISNWWGLALLVVAVAVVPLGIWIFNTAGKGWPVAQA
jgi:hypothetical protein